VITPDWPAPANVKAVCSTRAGGCSVGPFHSLNLGSHVGDDALAVNRNRQLLQSIAQMPGQPAWLNQTHSSRCITLSAGSDYTSDSDDRDADASFSRHSGLVCAVMTADCLPVLICNQAGTEIAAVHAGWRGLCNGVIENTMRLFSQPASCLAWLGPAISQPVFEVGGEVRAAFMQQDPAAASAFIATEQDKWLADLYLLARQRLVGVGVRAVYGGDYCTYRQTADFFSYRRDGQTGRMAAAIWLE